MLTMETLRPGMLLRVRHDMECLHPGKDYELHFHNGEFWVDCDQGQHCLGYRSLKDFYEHVPDPRTAAVRAYISKELRT